MLVHWRRSRSQFDGVGSCTYRSRSLSELPIENVFVFMHGFADEKPRLSIYYNKCDMTESFVELAFDLIAKWFKHSSTGAFFSSSSP